MKFFHTADWHLGKLIQGVYMTFDQRYILEQFLQDIEHEKPDVVVIAGDLYDRAVPPIDAVELLDEVLKTIVIDLKTPVLAIAGNHDSPLRLNFGSKMMRANGLHLMGQLSHPIEPIKFKDKFGEIHFHLIPYADPSIVRGLLQNEAIRSHQEAYTALLSEIESRLSPHARHVLVTHAFVTPFGEPKENTSDSERPLSIGGEEHVDARLFESFHYTALGHLHQAHHVGIPHIRYSGSPMKYSISEEKHNKGYSIVQIDGEGQVTIQHKSLIPRHNMRIVEAKMDDILLQSMNEDYVFVRLLDDTPILSPMEKIRSVFPNAMHVERKLNVLPDKLDKTSMVQRQKMDELSLFKAFYKEMKGTEPKEETIVLFQEVLHELLRDEKVMV